MTAAIVVAILLCYFFFSYCFFFSITTNSIPLIASIIREGYIKRIKGEPPGPGQFAPVINIITDKDRQLLQSQF
jgi:hypothetical protein